MPHLRVLLTQQELDPSRLDEQVVIVLDILFATSTIAHAFAEGVQSVQPARDEADAMRIGAQRPDCVLAGEFLTAALPGFAPAAPLMLARTGLHGRHLVFATTNGTPAFHLAEGAAHVYAGALLNGAALAAHVMRAHPHASVLLVCAGSQGRFNIEDFCGAGHIAGHFGRNTDYAFDDAALAARLLAGSVDPRELLLASRVGRGMLAMDLRDEVEYAANRDTLDVVPQLVSGTLVRAAA